MAFQSERRIADKRLLDLLQVFRTNGPCGAGGKPSYPRVGCDSHYIKIVEYSRSNFLLRPGNSDLEIFNSRYLIAYRRMLGLFAFFYATLHLTSYVVIDLQLNWNNFVQDLIKRNFILFGMITVVLMAPLAITSNKKMIKLLGSKAWQRLHLLIYPIAILGVFHFFMMVRADYSRPLIYLSVILALLAYRYWKNLITVTPKPPVDQSSKSAKQSFYKRVLYLPRTIKSSK